MIDNREIVQLSALEERLFKRTKFIIGTILIVLVIRVLYFSGFIGLTSETVLVDFDLFHLVSRTVWDGNLERVYHFPYLLELMETYRGANSLMPWAYPPPFDLFLAPLGFLSLGVAYTIFVGVTFLLWLCVVYRLAGPLAPLPILMTFPAITMEISCGQNGFLTGLLLGAAGLFARSNRAVAGLPLGMMIVKPHLAVTLGLLAVMLRMWKVISVAAVVALVLCALSTVFFGPEIWEAYRNGVKESAALLKLGAFPLFRMVSVYSAVRSFALPAELAFAAQAAASLFVILVIIRVTLNAQPERAIALSVLAAPLITPYAYDYDLPIATIGLAMIAKDFVNFSTLSERKFAYLFGLISSGLGGVLYFVSTQMGPTTALDVGGPPTLAGFFYLGLFIIVWRVVMRGEAATETSGHVVKAQVNCQSTA